MCLNQHVFLFYRVVGPDQSTHFKDLLTCLKEASQLEPSLPPSLPRSLPRSLPQGLTRACRPSLPIFPHPPHLPLLICLPSLEGRATAWLACAVRSDWRSLFSVIAFSPSDLLSLLKGSIVFSRTGTTLLQRGSEWEVDQVGGDFPMSW